MSDTEFWESSPAKIFALLDYHVKVENPDKAKNDVKNMPKMTPDLFKQWGGGIKQPQIDWREKRWLMQMQVS